MGSFSLECVSATYSTSEGSQSFNTQHKDGERCADPLSPFLFYLLKTKESVKEMKNLIKAYKEFKLKKAQRDIEYDYSLVNGEREPMGKIEKFHDDFNYFFPITFRIYIYFWKFIFLTYLITSLIFTPFPFIILNKKILCYIFLIEWFLSIIIFIIVEICHLKDIYKKEVENDRNGRVDLGNIFREFTKL